MVAILAGIVGYAIKTGSDFHVFYVAGTRALEGSDIYRWSDHWMVFKYMPIWSILFSPFALLPEKVSCFLFVLLQILFWIQSARIWFGWLGYEFNNPTHLFLLLMLSANALSAEIGYGQINGFIFFAVTQILNWLKDGNQDPWRAGAVAALLFSLKVNLIFLLIYCLFRNAKSVFGFVTMGCALYGATVAYYGFETTTQLYQQWWSILIGQSTSQFFIFECQGLFRFFGSIFGESAKVFWSMSVLLLLGFGIRLARSKTISYPAIAAYWLALMFYISPLAWWYQILFVYPMIFFVIRYAPTLLTRRIVEVCAVAIALANFNILGRSSLIQFKEWQGFFAFSVIVFCAYLISIKSQYRERISSSY